MQFAIFALKYLLLCVLIFQGPFDESIIKRAVNQGSVEIVLHDIRDYTLDKHKKVDDYPFGGGAGMVMQIEPIARLIDKLKAQRHYDEIIYMKHQMIILGNSFMRQRIFF